VAGDETVIVLARHADPYNPRGVFYGHLDGFGLSATGREQACGLGDRLRDLPIARAYASPLQRAQETAALAVGRLAAPVPIITRDDLVEAEFGKYLQGVPRAQVVWRRPLFLVHFLRPGALPFDETVGAMAARVDRVCVEAREACAGQAALVVSHADPVKAFWSRKLGRPDWRFHGLRLPKGGWLELRFRGDTLAAISPHPPVRAPVTARVS